MEENKQNHQMSDEESASQMVELFDTLFGHIPEWKAATEKVQKEIAEERHIKDIIDRVGRILEPLEKIVEQSLRAEEIPGCVMEAEHRRQVVLGAIENGSLKVEGYDPEHPDMPVYSVADAGGIQKKSFIEGYDFALKRLETIIGLLEKLNPDFAQTVDTINTLMRR